MKNKILILLSSFLFIFTGTKANHLFGGEFYYTYVSGNTYAFNLNLYADCSTGNPSLLTNLYNSNPIVYRYNNNVLIDSFALSYIAGSATDVTPTCPGITTTCASTSGTQQGVRMYKFSGTKNLGSTSANWKFLFTGNLNAGTGGGLAGRSTSITNLTVGVTIMSLAATLNNLGQTNSAPSYTTIPTPFYCANKVANYNQGAVDPNGDSLTFALVPGMIGSTGTTVNYLAPYTATAPLAVSAGTFSFGASNGQLTFTPNATQMSLVVTKVTEWRNGIIVGTSMREMTIVVLNCNNNPPSGGINSASGGLVDSSTSVTTCASTPFFNFTIPVSEVGGVNNITCTYTGNPTGSTISIANNGTPTPTITFTWNSPTGMPIGNYVFYVTYQDDACPLSSKQTIAYTVHVVPNISVSAVTTPAICTATNGGSITATVTGGTPTFTYNLNGGAAQSSNVFNPVVASTYTVSITDAKGCTASTIATVALLAPPIISNIVKTTASCIPGCDASITATATSPSGATLTYSKDGITFVATNVFTSLCVGNYTITVKDANGCTATTPVSIVNPTVVSITSLATTVASCSPGCDAVISNIVASPTGVYTYDLNTGTFQASSTFNNNCVGTYTVSVKDVNGCQATSTTIIASPPNPVFTNATASLASCTPGCDATISAITGTTTYTPFTYAINAGTYQTTNSFSNKCVGTYTLSIKDAKGCTATSTVQISSPPAPVITSMSIINASCTPGCDGQITGITATSASPTFTYAINVGAYQTNNSFTGLCANSYTITVKDGVGCTKSSVAALPTQPLPVITATTPTPASCVPGCDGSIAITAISSLTLSYTANTTSYQASNTIGSLCVGNYTVTVKDTKNCTASSIVNVLQSPAPSFTSSTSSNISCYGKNDGSIAATATGTGLVTYLLMPVNTAGNGTYNNLLPNNYTLTATDSKGCTVSKIYTITEPSLFTFSAITVSDQKCMDKADGSITAQVTGGNGNNTFLLNPNAVTNSTGFFSQLLPNTYSLTVTDGKGCFKDTILSLMPAINPMQISVTWKDIACNGTATDGTATVIATAGATPYQYVWNTTPPQNTATATGLFAGWFIVAVADNNGCVATDSVYLKDPSYCCEEISLPNAFSPNGDNVNDVFLINPVSPLELKQFAIYNRFGEKVWETTNVNNSWNGTFKDKYCDMGTYFFLLRYKCLTNNKDYEKKGDLLLVR